MSRLRAAIIGCGGIAQVHMAVLRAIPEAELVACADIKPERAEAMAAACGIRAYTDAEKLMDREKPDVVHLCVPHPLHTPLAALAAERNIHVFTEKPPVVSRAQWRQFSALKEKNVYVGVCFQNRYNESVARALEIMRSPEAGRVLGARAFVTWNREAPYYRDSDWRGSWKTEGGGELINQSIHTLDLLTQLLGKPTGVETTMRNHSLRDAIEVEDTVEAYITFEGGRRALFYGSNAYAANAPVMIEIACERVRIRIEESEVACYWQGGAVDRRTYTGAEPLGKDYWGNGHAACIQDFYRCILSGERFRNDIDSVADTMSLMLTMYDAYRGRRIDADVQTQSPALG